MYIFKSRGDGHILLDEQMTMESLPSNPSSNILNWKSKMLHWKWVGLATTMVFFICIGLIFIKSTNNDEEFINGQ